jgi:uncharacterized protein (TIGR03643 family)
VTVKKELTDLEKDRVIEMAWEDRTTFDAILLQFGLKEQEVINLMRAEMKPSSFKMWRERVQGRKTKHEKLRDFREDLNALCKDKLTTTKFLNDNSHSTTKINFNN